MSEPTRLLLGHRFKKRHWVTVDITGMPDMVWDLNKPLEIEDSSVDQIVGLHVLEHLRPKNVFRAIKSWHRVLKDTGVLILELPDINAVFKEYLKENDTKRKKLLKQYIYGNQEDKGQTHYWGWDREEICGLLKEVGFEVEDIRDGEDYHSEEAPCMRVEAKK